MNFTLWEANPLSSFTTDRVCPAFKRVGDRTRGFQVDLQEPQRELMGYLLPGMGLPP